MEGELRQIFIKGQIHEARHPTIREAKYAKGARGCILCQLPSDPMVLRARLAL